MSEKIIYIDGIGNINFKHSARARYLNISVKPLVGVTVSVPYWASYISAVSLVREKKEWIKKHLDKVKELERKQTVYDENSGYCTKNYKLNLRKGDRKNISIRLSNGEINVIYPHELRYDSLAVQNAIRLGIERALRIEAKNYLPDRVRVLADKYGLSFNNLAVKNIKSRWGSCSGKNNINLSIHLMRLPEHLIDYVILHELVHTVHHNHSSRFWNLLDKVTGNAKQLDKELRKYRMVFY